MTTGALQGLVYGEGLRPFRRPAVLGSELVAFSAILTCRHAGIRPVALVEEGARVTARFPAALLPRVTGIPLLLSTRVASVEGRDRVESVVVEGPDGARRLDADGLIVTGRFRPEATLVQEGHLAIDPATGGPEIDEYGRTSDPAIFAAGNVLRPVETAGWCWEEGRRVGKAMAAALAGRLPAPAGSRIALGGRLRYAIPQRRRGARMRLSTSCRCAPSAPPAGGFRCGPTDTRSRGGAARSSPNAASSCRFRRWAARPKWRWRSRRDHPCHRSGHHEHPCRGGA
jgi:hypothetical protein